MKNRLSYRVWQFWQSFAPALSQNEWDRIRLYLSPVEIILFSKLPVPDQNHSFRVFKSLIDLGEYDEDLIKAALLHDIGKGLHTLSRWERVFAVVVRGFSPELARSWGEGKPESYKRPLVIIHQHPAWGADLAEEAGCSDDVVWLIRNHEISQPLAATFPNRLELLQKLQMADNQN